MKNIIIITQREFITNIKKKTFLIMTFLAPFLFIAAIAVVVFMVKANQTTTHVAVIDHSHLFEKALKSKDEIVYDFYNSAEEKSISDSLVNSKNIDALLIIPAIKDSAYKNIEKDIIFYTNKNIGLSAQTEIANSIEKEIEDKRFIQYGIDQKKLDEIHSKVVFSVINKKDGTEENSDSVVKQIISIVLLFFIYTFILVYGMRVMRSVMEEKNNRVIEIIISSVKPFDLMMGKILGTTLVAFLQFFIWILLSVVFTQIFGSVAGINLAQNNLMAQQIPNEANGNMQEMMTNIQPYIHELLQMNIPLILFVFVFYFLFGYLFYSAMLASIGAAVDSETETQQFLPFLLIPLMLGFYGSVFTFENPEGPVPFWLSIIPITSPIAMVARITYGVPTWQLVLSMVLLVVSVFFMIKICAKVYRIGILMYGKKNQYQRGLEMDKNGILGVQQIFSPYFFKRI